MVMAGKSAHTGGWHLTPRPEPESTPLLRYGGQAITSRNSGEKITQPLFRLKHILLRHKTGFQFPKNSFAGPARSDGGRPSDFSARVKAVFKKEMGRSGRIGTPIRPGQFQIQQFVQAPEGFRMHREIVRTQRTGDTVFQGRKYGVQQTMLGNDQAVWVPIVPLIVRRICR